MSNEAMEKLYESILAKQVIVNKEKTDKNAIQENKQTEIIQTGVEQYLPSKK